MKYHKAVLWTPVLIGSETYPGNNVTTDEQILQIIMSSSDSIHHAAGTNRMALANDLMAVVESQGTYVRRFAAAIIGVTLCSS